MYRLTEDPDALLCLATGVTIPRGSYLWPAEWLMENTPLPIPPPYELYSPAHFRDIREKAWEWMTSWVVERRYDSIETCVGYYNSGVERYRMEARAMVEWRDAVNLELERMVLNPPTGIETWDQVRALLPQPEAFNWPSEVSLPLATGESAVLA